MDHAERRLQGRRNREKGKRFEREVARTMREILDPTARRTSQFCGADSADVLMKLFWVECKVGARPNINGAMDQAQRDAKSAGSSKEPLVISKRDREQTLVTMTMDTFSEIAKAYINLLKSAEVEQ